MVPLTARAVVAGLQPRLLEARDEHPALDVAGELLRVLPGAARDSEVAGVPWRAVAASIGATVDQMSGQYGAAYTFRGGRQGLISRLQLQPAGGSAEDVDAKPRVRFDLYVVDEETAIRVLRILAEAETRRV